MKSEVVLADYTSSGLFEALRQLGIRNALINCKSHRLSWVDAKTAVVDDSSPNLVKSKDVEILPLNDHTYLEIVDEFIPKCDLKGEVVDSYKNFIPQLWKDSYHRHHLIQRTTFSVYEKSGSFGIAPVKIEVSGVELDEIVLSTQLLDEGWAIATMTKCANSSYASCDTVILVPDYSKQPQELRQLGKVHWASGDGVNKGTLAFDYHQEARQRLIDIITKYSRNHVN